MNRRQVIWTAIVGVLGVDKVAGQAREIMVPGCFRKLDHNPHEDCSAFLKSDESVCPLGHVMKPRQVAYADGKMGPNWMEFKSESNNYNYKMHVCSTCGIVYVPMDAKEPGK
jgi:hypothetical protein